MPPLCGRLVIEGMASLKDLKESFTFEDAHLLTEALTLKNYHAWLSSRQNDEV